jgi:hypothetical protein
VQSDISGDFDGFAVALSRSERPRRENPDGCLIQVVAPRAVDHGSSPVPVLILYGTARVDEDGLVDFYDDIYGHDAKLAMALAKGYPY